MVVTLREFFLFEPGSNDKLMNLIWTPLKVYNGCNLLIGPLLVACHGLREMREKNS